MVLANLRSYFLRQDLWCVIGGAALTWGRGDVGAKAGVSRAGTDRTARRTNAPHRRVHPAGVPYAPLHAPPLPARCSCCQRGR